jgi:hypothetical protein
MVLTDILQDNSHAVGKPFNFSQCEMFISNSATLYKIINFNYVIAGAIDPSLYIGGGTYLTASEINKISLIASGDSIGIGSHFILWGCL